MAEKNYNSTYSRQIGEHMVVAELGRREILATPFAGNVPDIDILAYRGGTSIPIQVKALAHGSWSFHMSGFCKMSMDGESQVIGAPVERADDQTVFIFVKIGNNAGEDKFYILTWLNLRDLAIQLHRQFLARNDGKRPRNPHSMHFGILPHHLAGYEGNWRLIEHQLIGRRALES